MAKTQIKNYVFKPGIGRLDNLFPDAYSLLERNKTFIQKEANAFIQNKINTGQPGYVGYTYNAAKCERDVGYVIDAYLEDLRYGGNETLRNTIKYYWDQDVAQVDGDRTPETDVHEFIGILIKDYIFTNTLYSALNTEQTQTVDISKTVQSLAYTPTGASYKPTTGVMELTLGSHSINVGDEIHIAPSSLTFTCARDGNATNHPYPRSSGVPNDYGKDKYYYSPVKVIDTTATTITVNVGVSSDTSVHTFVSATANAITAGAPAKINTLAFNTVDVIENGLSALPVLSPIGVGTVKIQGRYNSDELLLISNSTRSEVLYNFTNVQTGAKVIVTDDNSSDSDFPFYIQTTDAVTLIELNYDTSSHSSTDELQVFVERIENGKSVVTTRPYDFGTDAIERNRIAQPLSMLDADFEYGLQPTKWAAIGTLRGYPSVYEVPGTDTPVLSVVTDASAGTQGVGQSLITVTTVSPHGFTAGTPITIKALEDSVNGAARAEGSFVIVTIVDSTSFTYYAKSKVGTISGTVLSTTYTQLRKAGFYTGADIGGSVFSVASQGSSGTMTTELGVLAGSTIIPYDDDPPEIGSPLETAGGEIPLGSQVTGIIDQSQGGGLYLTPTVVGDVPAGTNQVTVSDVTGIVENLAVDRGDGFAIYVSSIAGSTLTFSDNFTEPVIGNTTNYTNLVGTNDTSDGENARFDISFAVDSSFTYVLDAIANDGGEGYEVGDRIIIPGTSLGGTTPENDALIIVTEILDSANSIADAEISGTHFNNDIYLPDQTAVFQGGNGSDATFDISYENGAFTSVVVNTSEIGFGYVPGDVIDVAGFLLSQNAAPSQFLRIGVDTVDANGGITSISFAGQAPAANRTVFNATYTTTSVSGTNAAFDVTVNGSNYEVNFTNTGVNYLATENFTVLGTLLGGTSPANDCTIVIDNVGVNGEITATTVSGVTFNGDTKIGQPGENVTPSGATFNVSQNGAQYVATISDPGDNYNVGMELLIPGTAFGAATPENDLTITVTSVIDLLGGSIDGISSSGTGYEPIGIYIDVLGANDPNVGSDATFNLTRDSGVYGNIISTNAGSGYKRGNRVLIPGFLLGGISPLNDLIIRVSSVDGLGAITGFTPDFIEASRGNNFDLISTVQMSEATTANMNRLTTIDFGSLATLQIEFPNAHGLVPGGSFIVGVGSADGSNNHNLVAGSFFVSDIPTVNTLRYQARAEGFIDTTTSIAGSVYPRPDSFFIHRPYDGGVQLGTGGPQHGAQAIRQSKKYIRYQSGKGIMYTTGALFAPSYDLRSLTADGVEVGSLITVVTDDNDHGVQEGGIIRLLGVETPGYNSGAETAVPPKFDYEVVQVIDERTFKVRAQRRLGATEAVLGFGSQMSVVSWHGATVRSGIFDDQNGIFWEFDGTQISVVQRTGTRQLAGTIAMDIDTNLITGTNTRFEDQLKAGDRIIIKGMTHVVTHVNDQTECTVTPDFRGVVNITGAKINLVVDKKVKQSEFNLDRLDGTGPSGYNIDIAKMQMIGIQYSWYGAGFIDFMLRGSDGNFVFAHRMRNSNVNTEAFMRSGNLPVRYEVANEGPSGKLAEAIDATQNYIVLEDSSFFPEYGTVYIDNEIIDFTGKNDTLNRLTGCIRGATFENFQAGANRQYTAGVAASHSARTGVVLISQTITPLISHWGSAFLTDGGFDEDRGYIFSYTEPGLEVTTTKQTAFLIRLSPSVSNALVGDLGERELLNRAQLLLQELEVTSESQSGGIPIEGGIVVEGILNPKNYPTNPADVLWQTLSTEAQGGQPSFAQIAAGGSIKWSDGAAATTATVNTQPVLSVTMQTNEFGGRNDEIDFDQSVYNTNGPVLIGSVVSSVNLNGDTVYDVADNRTVENVQFRSRDGDYRIKISDDPDAGYQQNNFTFAFGGNLVNRNFAYVSKSSFDASGASTGTVVTGGTVTFPANTSISNVTLLNHGGTEFYRLTFNNSFTGTLSATSGNIQFTFEEPPYAQPGETIFSFIAQPGERSTVDFSELKELTNTPLGGRGTYPNGPDVLAINVYKVSGASSESNLILKWGEAQA